VDVLFGSAKIAQSGKRTVDDTACAKDASRAYATPGSSTVAGRIVGKGCVPGPRSTLTEPWSVLIAVVRGSWVTTETFKYTEMAEMDTRHANRQDAEERRLIAFDFPIGGSSDKMSA